MLYFGTPEKMHTIKTVETLLTILVSLVFYLDLCPCIKNLKIY